MRERFAEQRDRHIVAGALLAGGDDIVEGVARVVALRLAAAGCDDRRSLDRHALAVGAAPVAVDGVGFGRQDVREERDADCSEQHRFPFHRTPLGVGPIGRC